MKRLHSAAMIAALIVSIGGLTACGGGGSTTNNHCFPNDRNCGVLTVGYEVGIADPWQTPDTPLPVGASVSIAFHEARCVSSAQHGGPPPGVGCGPWFVPPVLAVYIYPLANSNGLPCPIAFTLTAPGTLRFTRTGPGDPIVGAGNRNARGYCEMDISDPSNASNSVSVFM